MKKILFFLLLCAFPFVANAQIVATLKWHMTISLQKLLKGYR